MEHTANQATEQKITTNKPPLHEEKPVIQELFSCDNFEEKIHGMISDPSFIELRRNSLDLSLFDVVGMTHTERWHSAFLAWLLNPSERSSHGLAYFPMKQLLSTMRKKARKELERERKLSPQDSKSNANEKSKFEKRYCSLPSQDLIDTGWFDDCEIMPDCYSDNYAKEKTFKYYSGNNDLKGSKCSLDIAFTATINPYCENDKKPNGEGIKRLLFICENKIKSSESHDQTKKYANWVENEAPFPLISGKEKSFIQDNERCTALLFLTPDGEEPKDSIFLALSYSEIMNDVLIPCSRHPDLKPEGKRLLEEYMLVLDRCNYAVREKNRTLATAIMEKHSLTLLELLKVLLFSELKFDESCELKLAWAARFIKQFKTVEIEDKKDSWLEVKVNFMKEDDKNPLTAFTTCGLIPEGGKNSKTLGNAKIKVDSFGHSTFDEFWDEYVEKFYNKGKVEYAANIHSKFAKTIQILCNFLQTGDFQDIQFENLEFTDNLSVNEDGNSDITKMCNHEQTANQGLKLMERIARCLFTSSKTWTDWSFLSEILKNQIDPLDNEDGEWLKVYFKNPKNVSDADQVYMQIGKQPQFRIRKDIYEKFKDSNNSGTVAAESDSSGTVTAESEYVKVSGLSATRCYANKYGTQNKSGAYQWSSYWCIKRGDKLVPINTLHS